MTEEEMQSLRDKFPSSQLSDGVLQLWDHIDGFDKDGNNQILPAFPPQEIHIEYLLPDWIKQKYPQHTLKFDANLFIKNSHFENALTHTASPDIVEIDNFLCCFNKHPHIGRQLLVESLILKGWFNPAYCSKWFKISGHKYSSHAEAAEKIIAHSAEDFHPMDFQTNLTALTPLVQASFLNIVSETIPESHIPFTTEKLLFPILNQRLWVAYAQPGYHKFVSEILGFRLYDNVFDYSFDTITDPPQRLAALIKSIEPYATLAKQDWHRIHKQMESTLEYNYQWATSGQFITQLRKLNEVNHIYNWNHKLKKLRIAKTS